MGILLKVNLKDEFSQDSKSAWVIEAHVWSKIFTLNFKN